MRWTMRFTAKICRKLPLAEGLATYPTEENY